MRCSRCLLHAATDILTKAVMETNRLNRVAIQDAVAPSRGKWEALSLYYFIVYLYCQNTNIKLN